VWWWRMSQDRGAHRLTRGGMASSQSRVFCPAARPRDRLGTPPRPARVVVSFSQLRVLGIGSIDTVMSNFQTFTEFLEQRDADRCAADPSLPLHHGGIGSPMTGYEIVDSNLSGERDQVAERSIYRGLFKSVNPARPVSPINSRLLASPFRKRLKSQIMGR